MKPLHILAVAAVFFLFAFGNRPAEAEEFTFGLLMVGPANDHGWSQAHFESGKEIEKQVAGTRMMYIDKINPADRPGITIPMLGATSGL